MKSAECVDERIASFCVKPLARFASQVASLCCLLVDRKAQCQTTGAKAFGYVLGMSNRSLQLTGCLLLGKLGKSSPRLPGVPVVIIGSASETRLANLPAAWTFAWAGMHWDHDGILTKVQEQFSFRLLIPRNKQVLLPQKYGQGTTLGEVTYSALEYD